MDKYTVAVLTATRAEYGLLRPVIQALSRQEVFQVSVLVTGAHLSPAFGYTVEEVRRDGFSIGAEIPILDELDTPLGMSCAMAKALTGFGEHFAAHQYDLLVVLGDRYETLAVCCAAMNARIPIAHLHGGETTEGAVDEAVRHAITKMSLLHFVSHADHRRRVIQLGEAPERVFDVGATGVENALHTPLLTKTALAKELGFPLDGPYVVATFHPTTLEGDEEGQFAQLAAALDAFPSLSVVFTKANADAGGRRLNALIEEYAARRPHVLAVTSLGTARYLSAVKHSALVVGNSSSGLLEAPSFRVPTVNIGNRQKGRLRAASVIDCPCETAAITAAIRRALSPDFRAGLSSVVNPYGDGDTSRRIASILTRELSQGLCLEKPFYDIKEATA